MLQHILADLAMTAKKRAPGLYALVRDATPSLLRNSMSLRIYQRHLGIAENREGIFTKIYQTDWWGSPESKSGTGSQLARTETFRRELKAWLQENHVTSMLDAPCGDYNWIQHLEFHPGFRYIGGDIVRELIESNRRRFPGVSFDQLDIVSDPLPVADAWLCRDALIHFPNASARAVLERFAASDIRYLLATTFPSVTENRDIAFGQYRPVNLRLHPFDMPAPRQVLRDDDDAAAGRVIGAWSRDDVRHAVAKRSSVAVPQKA
jgi:hypothetical protein